MDWLKRIGASGAKATDVRLASTLIWACSSPRAWGIASWGSRSVLESNVSRGGLGAR